MAGRRAAPRPACDRDRARRQGAVTIGSAGAVGWEGTPGARASASTPRPWVRPVRRQGQERQPPRLPRPSGTSAGRAHPRWPAMGRQQPGPGSCRAHSRARWRHHRREAGLQVRSHRRTCSAPLTITTDWLLADDPGSTGVAPGAREARLTAREAALRSAQRPGTPSAAHPGVHLERQGRLRANGPLERAAWAWGSSWHRAQGPWASPRACQDRALLGAGSDAPPGRPSCQASERSRAPWEA